ncbi:hypothetical protein GN956_G19236 [Arapaima gigas]
MHVGGLPSRELDGMSPGSAGLMSRPEPGGSQGAAARQEFRHRLQNCNVARSAKENGAKNPSNGCHVETVEKLMALCLCEREEDIAGVRCAHFVEPEGGMCGVVLHRHARVQETFRETREAAPKPADPPRMMLSEPIPSRGAKLPPLGIRDSGPPQCGAKEPPFMPPEAGLWGSSGLDTLI